MVENKAIWSRTRRLISSTLKYIRYRVKAPCDSTNPNHGQARYRFETTWKIATRPNDRYQGTEGYQKHEFGVPPPFVDRPGASGDL